MSGRRFLDPNLASQPYENSRPILRLALLLWTLAFVAVGAAIFLAFDVRRATGEQQRTLDGLTAEAAAARGGASRLQAELERADLEEQNQRTDFLNERIAERAFSWNDLFDTLGQVLPRGVRVHDLSPLGFGAPERPGARTTKKVASTTSLVNMRIAGVAEDTEALLAFVDRLYGHPAFVEPNLAHEATVRENQIEFTLSVGFLPGAASAGPALAEAGAESGGPASAAPAGAGMSAGATSGAGARPAIAGASGGAAPAAGGALVAVPPAQPSAPAAGGVGGIERYRPGANPSTRETTSRYGGAVGAAEEPAAGAGQRGASGDRRSTRGAPVDPRFQGGVPGGAPLPGGAVPVLPTPLKPFASAPQGVR